MTIIDDQSPFLKRISESKKSVLIQDTAKEEDWQTFKGHQHLRSWLSVPLPASGEYLGMLSVGHAETNQLTEDHLRRAELLAIPAAAAIENARLYARAEIFASELEKRLTDLKVAETALQQAQGDRRISEDRFQKVFRSSPVPFSITTHKEGKFVDVKAAFERRYGYSRQELIGQTVHELRIWEGAADRVQMIAQLERGGPIRNVMTRIRTKSGEVTQLIPRTRYISTGSRAFSPCPETYSNTSHTRPIEFVRAISSCCFTNFEHFDLTFRLFGIATGLSEAATFGWVPIFHSPGKPSSPADYEYSEQSKQINLVVHVRNPDHLKEKTPLASRSA